MDELNRFEKEELLKQLKIEWTYNSNAIEGNTINLGDTAFVIEHGLTVKGKSLKEHHEVIGHAKAIDIIYTILDKDELQANDIFILHKAIITEFIVDTEAPMGAYKVVENGRYVRINEKATYVPYPHPEDIDHLMGLWFESFSIFKKLHSFDECVELYTDMHLAFASIHPFFDGNGRLARLLANIPLLKNGYLPLIVSNEDRQEYIELLSSYNLEAKVLDKNSTNLIEKNEQYEKLKEFFKDQYKHSQRLLDEIRRSR